MLKQPGLPVDFAKAKGGIEFNAIAFLVES